jgi:hypothetical protein
MVSSLFPKSGMKQLKTRESSAAAAAAALLFLFQFPSQQTGEFSRGAS